MSRSEVFREKLEAHWRESAKADPFEEIRSQAAWLENEIASELAALRTLSHEMGILRKELYSFVTEYCEGIAGAMGTLQQLDAMLAERGVQDKTAEERGSEISELHFSYAPQEAADISSEEVKRLYRRLAKSLHPDAAPENPRAAEMFALLNSSYTNRDLAGLVRLQREVSAYVPEGEQNPILKLERLEREYDAAKNAADALRREKHEFSISPAYKLQQYAVWYRMCGDNLIARTTRKLEAEIAAKRRLLGVFVDAE